MEIETSNAESQLQPDGSGTAPFVLLFLVITDFRIPEVLMREMKICLVCVPYRATTKY